MEEEDKLDGLLDPRVKNTTARRLNPEFVAGEKDRILKNRLASLRRGSDMDLSNEESRAETPKEVSKYEQISLKSKQLEDALNRLDQ